MPQMAPISWLSLFIVFSLTLVIFSTLNYFCFLPQTPKTSSKTTTTSFSPLTWKW